MTRDDLLASLQASTELFRSEGVRHVSLFGSRARGDGRPDSDVDLLVEYDAAKRVSLSDLCHLEAALSQKLGLEVQITASPVRSKYLQKAITADAIAVL
jgi:predicted nucleotidyltransferase